MFQETQILMDKIILEKESEMLELRLKLREINDEITHLKTREMSLIDRSEKGQLTS